MEAIIDLDSGLGFVYDALTAVCDAGVRINALIDAALEAEHRSKPPRTYLGGSRIGEPCARRLAYEITHTPVDGGMGFGAGLLRIFDAGHQFEVLAIRWLQAAGFDLRTRDRDGGQFGFSIAGGRIRGHIDGVILGGPEVGIRWPALFEHKASNQKSWTDLVKRGLRHSKPIYFAQCQLYMAYMGLDVALLTAMNKNTQELYHEVVPFDPADAQRLSEGRSKSCAPRRPRSCRRGSQTRPTSTSAGGAPTPGAAGRAIHERELHPVRPASDGDP